MEISDKIGKLGRIKRGPHAGFFIRIDDDSKSTGGFLILIWQDAPKAEGYDDWVENLDGLERYLKRRESEWGIEWFE